MGWKINISSGHCNSVLTGVTVWHWAGKSIKPLSFIFWSLSFVYTLHDFVGPTSKMEEEEDGQEGGWCYPFKLQNEEKGKGWRGKWVQEGFQD